MQVGTNMGVLGVALGTVCQVADMLLDAMEQTVVNNQVSPKTLT